MKTLTIIHNPRCSKSREALELIQGHGYEAKIVDYLSGELTEKLLKEILKLLDVPAKSILRTKEEEFKTLQIDLDNDKEVMDVILKHPKLLERPIVFNEETAVIGRPPENVLKLLE